MLNMKNIYHDMTGRILNMSLQDYHSLIIPSHKYIGTVIRYFADGIKIIYQLTLK